MPHQALVVYADDFVATFQHKDEAERFLETVKERFKESGLELELEKTRLIEFGRFAQVNRAKPRQAGNLRFSRIHVLLFQESKRETPSQAKDVQEENEDAAH